MSHHWAERAWEVQSHWSKLNGVLLLDLCACHSLPIINTMFKHKGIHQCQWHQETLDRRSMINDHFFSHVIWSPAVHLGILGVERGWAVSWQWTKSDWLGRPKRTVRVCWKHLAEPTVREVFNCHLWESFDQVLREVGDIGSKWTMLSTSTIDAAEHSRGRSITGACGNPWTRWWTSEISQTSSWRKSPIKPGRLKEQLTNTGRHASDVTEVVQKLLSGRATGVEKIYLKSLDVAGQSWLTHLCNIAWQLGSVLQDWQTGVAVPLFKKGGLRMSPSYRKITPLSLPAKVYSRMLERRIQPRAEPQIQEEQCCFWPGCGTLDHLPTLHSAREIMGVYLTSPHRFVDLGKEFEYVPPLLLWEYEVGGL